MASATTTPTFAVGDRVILAVKLPALPGLQGHAATVEEVIIDPRCDPQLRVAFDNHPDAGKGRAFSCRYFTREPVAGDKAPQRRRPVLNMHEPKDTRTEAERMAAGLALLAGWGYEYLTVGQSRAPAMCHKCSRQKGSMVQIHCRHCNSLGYSPSTNSTKGTPDSFVWHPSWGSLLMLPLEWKDGPHGARTDEQKVLEAAGRITVAWDEASAVVAVARFERRYLPDGLDSPAATWLSERGLLEEAA